ncbi:uncharacterized protein LOC110247556 isoform X1 [Exaiptasia diaphana]|uniref:Transposase domain-containing protein n=1 Tax=Exaiptasia diaphana TaxID=2652724 RepID=A0A913YQX5_EXADI|nr:uncharacterized protein LOC110247556 isoform X1 [Exaiptasia diaphana]
MAKRGPYKSYLELDEAEDVPRTTKYYRKLHIQAVNVSQDSSTTSQRPKSFDSDEEKLENFNNASDECSLESINDNEQPLELGTSIKTSFETHEDQGDVFSPYEWDIEERQNKEEFFADDNEVNLFDEIFIGESEQTSNESLGLVAVERNDRCESLLYDGAPITLGSSMLLTITFALSHNLTGEALADLLSLIACHCKTPNLCPLSIRMFNKHFENLKTPLVCHYYCKFCFALRVDVNTFQCRECLSIMDKEQASKSFFIESPVAEQLKTLFSRNGFYDLMSYREKRIKKQDNNIEDILDGTEYEKLKAKGGFLSFKNHFSFMFNTDGVAIFRSSAFSIWPLYLQLNELPPHLRSNSKNVIFAGMWFGENKPYMNTFLQPFKESLETLQSQGLQVTAKSNDVERIVDMKFMLLSSTFDLPAKCMVQEFSQFNAFYGCSVCKKPGCTCPTSEKGHTHAYPMTVQEYDLPSGHPPLRTIESTTRYARKAVRQNKPVKGVKGFSILHDLKGFNIIRGVAVDYMHCVLLGVVKMLLHLWFDTSQKGKPYFCGKNIDQAEERLLSIKPTSNITRTPRSIGEHRKYWKASELRAWLIYYSGPVMINILPKKYLKHYMCLVRGVYLLLQGSISKDDLAESCNLLSTFVFYMDILYG